MTKFSVEEIIEAASNSDKESVKKAYQKLVFAVQMSHTAEEIDELATQNMHHLRVSEKSRDGTTYEHFMIRWRGDEFLMYIPSEGQPVAGKATKLDKDPAIVYLNKPAKKVEIK